MALFTKFTIFQLLNSFTIGVIFTDIKILVITTYKLDKLQPKPFQLEIKNVLEQ